MNVKPFDNVPDNNRYATVYSMRREYPCIRRRPYHKNSEPFIKAQLGRCFE